jgi:RNA polymerase sigma factor (sigma-70 family)
MGAFASSGQDAKQASLLRMHEGRGHHGLFTHSFWTGCNDPGLGGPWQGVGDVASNDRLREVFEAEHARLWRSVLAHCGDRDIASDAVAEAFAQAVRRGDELRDPAAWVWRAAFRIAGGQLATRHRWDPAYEGAQSSTDALPDEVAALLDALGRLGEVERRVVVLSLVGGLSATEVGRIVGASPGAVRVRLHRARRRLRDALTAENTSIPTSPRRDHGR